MCSTPDIGEKRDAEEIRDPIHGLIEFTPNEMEVIDSRPLQRARRIRQLAFTHLVYPGAMHTRFEHSIGVCHVAGRIATRLGLTDDEKTLARLAALLHDIGHPAFSHVGEEVIKHCSKDDEDLPEHIHEFVAAAIIRQDDSIGTAFDHLGISKDEVAAIIDGTSKKSLLKSIVSGPVDSDRLDYLLRDSTAVGVSYGQYDLDRIINTLTAIEDGEDSVIGFRQEGIEAVEQLLIARYHMNAQVYQHRIRLITDAMAMRAMCLAIDTGVLDRNIFTYQQVNRDSSTFLRSDDDGIARTVLEGNDEYAKELFERLESRRLLSEVFTIDLFPASHASDERVFELTEKKDNKMICELEQDFSKAFDLPQEMTIVKVQETNSPNLRGPGKPISTARLLIKMKKGKPRIFESVSHVFDTNYMKDTLYTVHVYAPAGNGFHKTKLEEEAKQVMLKVIGRVE